MNRLTRLAVVTTLIVTLAVSTATAQLVVHDPINYAQSLARYAQLLQQYRFWIEQARRLPGDMAARYRVAATRWRNHDNEGQYRYARPILTALNVGDTGGTLYRQVTDLLEPLAPLLPSVPAEFRRRLATIYASIELADSVAKMAIHQVGAIRSNGRPTLTAIENMENDALAAGNAFHTQTALLNKINGANVLGLRINETANQFQMHILEQLLVQNKRSRDAEAQVMDAHLFQWRYGTTYGRDLFSRTAAGLDQWRQP